MSLNAYSRNSIYCLVGMLLITVRLTGQDTSMVHQAYDTLSLGDSKAGYHAMKSAGGANSVNADLKDDDKLKSTWLDFNFTKRVFRPYYNLKRGLYEKARIAIGSDYMFLNQYASYSFSERNATSGIFRFFGTWEAIDKADKKTGSLTLKIENRHAIIDSQTPRNLGYEAGAALSTASYKHFSWGLTNFYWKQIYRKKYAFVAGVMDPGDWVDLYPLLNPFKYYLNEAFFNSPAMAIPNQGLGFAFALDKLVSNFYLAAGLHDANGEPTYFLIDNVQSFFTVKEFFYWVELGWNPKGHILGGETVHLTYWHQDSRLEQGTEESWGWCFSASRVFYHTYTTFFRAAISNGNGALMHHLIKGGISAKYFGSDRLGLGFSWGGPNDRSRRNQYGLEVFYSMQITQNLNLMPDIQLTFHPSFNDEKDFVGVYSVVRLRYAL